MKEYADKIAVILGGVTMLGGMVAIIAGKVGLGLLALLVGLLLLAVFYATMMHGRGFDPNQGTFNGLYGQGKQQSEAVPANMPEPGEQSPAVWDKMENSQ